MDKKIGLLVGREWSFPPAFIEEVNGRNVGVTAEYVSLDITRMGVPGEYDVIIDRISHEIGFYRAYLKHAALLGTKVVNNPFMWSADDKFFGRVARVHAWRSQSSVSRKTRLNTQCEPARGSSSRHR